jgi:hypothetical protein
MHVIAKASMRALALLSLSACAGDGSGGEALDPSAFERWKEREPSDYVVQVCTMNIQPPGCQRALIVDGEVVSAQERIYGYHGADTGWDEYSAQDREASGSLLDWMFTDAAGSDEEDCVIDDIRYDGEYGYIDSYEVRCDGHALGGHYVACFEPDANEIAACDVAPE